MYTISGIIVISIKKKKSQKNRFQTTKTNFHDFSITEKGYILKNLYNSKIVNRFLRINTLITKIQIIKLFARI